MPCAHCSGALGSPTLPRSLSPRWRCGRGSPVGVRCGGCRAVPLGAWGSCGISRPCAQRGGVTRDRGSAPAGGHRAATRRYFPSWCYRFVPWAEGACCSPAACQATAWYPLPPSALGRPGFGSPCLRQALQTFSRDPWEVRTSRALEGTWAFSVGLTVRTHKPGLGLSLPLRAAKCTRRKPRRRASREGRGPALSMGAADPGSSFQA